MKTYKFLALVTLVSIFTVNFAAADNEVTLTRSGQDPVSGANIQAVIGTGGIQDGDIFTVNDNYQEPGQLILNRNNITIKGTSSDSTYPTITAPSNVRLLKSDNTDYAPTTINLTLENTTFSNGYCAQNGGFAYLVGDNYVVTGKNVTIQDCVADGSYGGAFYFDRNATFAGTDSNLTFTGNKTYNGKNDIYCGRDLLFTESGTYNLDGGIVSMGSLTISEGASINLNSGSVNSLKTLNISGENTLAKFANGSTTEISGTTTIQNTGTTTVDDNTVNNIEFQGNQTFGEAVVSNGGKVTFAGTNTSTGTVTITGSDTKAHFDGAQQLSTVKVTNKAEADITPINKFTQSGIYVDDFGKLEINGDFNVDGQSTKVEVGKNGVVDLLWADQEEIFNSDLIINGGGSVNLSNTTGNLNVTGTIDGEASGALNLAIMKSAMTADSETNLYGVTGNTLTVKALGDGNDYIDLRASDFAYHDESQMFELINLTNGQLTLGDFLQAVQLPFSWFGSVVKDDYTFIDQDLSAAGSKFYVFKVDGDKVPEPSTWALLILGVAGLYLVRRKNLAK